MNVFYLSVILLVIEVLSYVVSTIIIVEDAKACFRRALAGKRVSRRFVKKALTCERVEDCQLECSEERRFICEGFNYRLDPTGRGKGDCELLDIPLSHLDLRVDIFPDREFDYYERDRNAASTNCDSYPKRPPYYDDWRYGSRRPRPSYPDKGYDYGRPYYPPPPMYNRRQDGFYNYYDRPGYNKRPPYDYERPIYDRYGPPPPGNRRGDYPNHHFHQHGIYHDKDRNSPHFHYLPPPTPSPDFDKRYEPYYPPVRRVDKPPDDGNRFSHHGSDGNLGGFNAGHWGTYGGTYGDFGQYDFFAHRNNNKLPTIPNNYYLPPKIGGSKWGTYGGTYGDGASYWGGNDYWDSNKSFYLPHIPTSVLPPKKGPSYVIPPRKEIVEIHVNNIGPNIQNHDSSLLPAEPRVDYNFLKDECSLRTATGFKLHKTVVKKYFTVPDIYQCELLCFKERDFPCASYAFRYTITLSTPFENCLLSNKNYKEIDFYTDVEPDRDFDIYSMNNMNRCLQPVISPKETSDCFWRVRSGHKLDDRIVRDSLLVKNIVDCQIACVEARRFICRAFSFRYGSPIIGSHIENCQLTDWPYYELDPKRDFIREPGFETYERGSFGHGCEPHHFGIRGRPDKHDGRIDQICYVGFGTPARLLPQATQKSLRVPSELECKVECSKYRKDTHFLCMSFSYRNSAPPNEDNCLLSNIYQRDLLPKIDYIHDPDSWLFSWDNYNPECVAVISGHIDPKPLHPGHIPQWEDRMYYESNALDTWRAYSVSGWPCRRGSLCKQNPIAGFWYCELEGGDADTWDYCCRPNHQCGYSAGYAYPWCYVGQERTQWRKCSNNYYPYINNIIDRMEYKPPHYLPLSWSGANSIPEYGSNIPSAPWRPGARPNRPPAPPAPQLPPPSLDKYEALFDDQFLEPPKPGGFTQPRHWPVSYLHKEKPPNTTDFKAPMRIKPEDVRLNAIQNLIKIIKSNELTDIEFQIGNDSKKDDILYVKIPLPTNLTDEKMYEKMRTLENKTKNSPKVEDDNFLKNEIRNNTKRENRIFRLASPALVVTENRKNETQTEKYNLPRPSYRRGYVTRTNITHHGRKSSFLTKDSNFRM